MNQNRGSPFSSNTLGHSAHPHRASAGPDCCVAGASGPAMQRGGGSKLKGLLRVPLRLPCSWALALMNRRWSAHNADHERPLSSPLPVMNGAAVRPSA